MWYTAEWKYTCCSIIYKRGKYKIMIIVALHMPCILRNQKTLTIHLHVNKCMYTHPMHDYIAMPVASYYGIL